MNEIVLTREELYKKIWEAPIRSVAKELGISDVGLAKICKRNGIPKPPPGYHLKKPRLAKERMLLPLPPANQGQLSEFKFRQSSELPTPVSNKFEDEFNEYLAVHDKELCAKDRRLVNYQIKKFKSQVNRKNIDERGIMIVPAMNFPIRVSPALYSRAESILKLFLTVLTHLDASVLPYSGASRNEQIGVNWLGYVFRFQIEENSKRIAVPKEKRSQRYSGYDMASDAWNLIPTGILSLKVNGPGYGSLALRDGKRLIEDRIYEIIKRMFVQAREKQEEERVEAIRMERAISHLQDKDKVRREGEFQTLRKKQLMRESRQWHRAEALKKYISMVKDAGYQSGQAFESEANWNEWLIWANEYIDSINPILSGESGKTPPYPEEKEITKVPYEYLKYDDLEEAEEEMSKCWWSR